MQGSTTTGRYAAFLAPTGRGPPVIGLIRPSRALDAVGNGHPGSASVVAAGERVPDCLQRSTPSGQMLRDSLEVVLKPGYRLVKRI